MGPGRVRCPFLPRLTPADAIRLLSVRPPPGASPLRERSRGLLLLVREGAVRGWGCWGYLPFFPPPPLQPLPRGLLSMVLTYPEDIQMKTEKSLVGDFDLRGWSHN